MSVFVFPPDPRVHILGTGHHLPDPVRDNAAVIAAGCDTTADDIVKKTGIVSRHIAPDDVATSDLAIAAAKACLDDAGLSAAGIDRLIVSTTSPDQPVPSTASFVHAGLGLDLECPAHDVAAACAGSLYALDAAARHVLTAGEVVLVVGADIRSRVLDVTDVGTAPLFADGAGALLLGPGPDAGGLLATAAFLDSRGRDKIGIVGGGSRRPLTAERLAAGEQHLRMVDGLDVYMSATEGMADAAARILDEAGVDKAAVSLVVPHQANGRILRRVAALAGLDDDKVFSCIETVGNTSSGSVLIALDRARRAGRVQAGDVVLLLAAGAGYACAAALWRVGDAP